MPQSRFYLIFVSFSKVITLVNANLLIAGSSNLDTFLRLRRLPQPGENLTLLPNTQPIIDIPGGKGCNQAIACKKLSSHSSEGAAVSFLGRIGNDKSGGAIIRKILQEHSVNIDHVEECEEFPTGRGYVFLEQDTGKVSAVVSGGSNMYGWGLHSDNVEALDSMASSVSSKIMLYSEDYLDDLFAGVNCLLLQREIPEAVNFILAKHAKGMKDRNSSHIVVLQDIGGEERDMDSAMMSQCDYIMPNLTELKRLVKSLSNSTDVDTESNNHDGIVALAKILQHHGAKNVLVTLAEEGSLLIKEDGSTVYQDAISLEQFDMTVVDETGAGDCYRAGFAVALMENKCIQDCMIFASAAGAIACTKEGAVPSIPSRHEVETLVEKSKLLSTVESIPRGGGDSENEELDDKDGEFPYFFGSRLNSMKDRPELWSKPVDNVREWVKRQGSIEGLGCVDFNYPQHFHDWEAKEAKKALDEVGLKAGAVCLRYPSKFARGAMNHPDKEMRREAIKITMEAAEVARELGCNEVVIWSACK